MAAAHERPLLVKIVASAVSISHRAGQIIRDVRTNQGNLEIVEKGKNDLQTEADRCSQECIMASLHKHFPKVHLIGEESQICADVEVPDEYIEPALSQDVLDHAAELPEHLQDIKEEDICIWIDSLDGTAEYTQGVWDHVTILIGIAIKGIAQAGVVNQPYYNYKPSNSEQPEANQKVVPGRAVWGIIGVGTFGMDVQKPPPEGRILTTSRSHATKAVVKAVEACQYTEVKRMGGAGRKTLLLLEGGAHAYVFASPGSQKWDTCAGEAVLHAAGGKMTDIHGNRFQYHADVDRRNMGIIATPDAEQHEWYLNQIPKNVKDILK